MKRTIASLLATATAATALAVAGGPALASTATHATTVNLAASVGSRQFYVEDLNGTDLASVNIGRSGSQPFRVRVADSAFSTVTQSYQLSATMNNLYLSDGAGGYTWATKVPSSSLAISFAPNPLSATGVSFSLTPLYNLTGTIGSGTCTSLGLPALAPLCILLSTAAQTVGSGQTAAVSGFSRTITPVIANVATDLPVQLTGALGGPFTNADYANGLGAGDPTKPASPPAATSVSLMTGTAALSPGLLAAIASQLPGGGTAVTSATDTASSALVPLAGALSALTASTNATVALLGQYISLLGNAAQESAVLNQLSAGLVPISLNQLDALTGNYVSFPVLGANAAVPQSGTYSGTMTVTFVQTP